MEPRKITIVQTKNQKKSVIESSATTLGELKDDLRTNGIDYSDMTFYEGLSKTELKTDESILPHDIERNGIITNELVFMLTNPEKKIKSGAMSRAEAYEAIKKNNLQAECQKMFGKNFTMCKTSDLISLIERKSTVKEDTETKIPTTEESTKVECAPTTPSSNKTHNCGGCKDTQARAALRKLIDLLAENYTLNDCDYNDILDVLGTEVEASTKKDESTTSLESPYTQDEINQMFRGMR